MCLDADNFVKNFYAISLKLRASLIKIPANFKLIGASVKTQLDISPLVNAHIDKVCAKDSSRDVFNEICYGIIKDRL